MSFRFRFKLIFQDKILKNTSEYMRQLDLDIGEAGIERTFIFTSEKDKPISEIKEDFKKAFEACDMTLLHIEGGKVE